MTNSNKTLLKALLEIEFELGRSQKIFEKESLFFSTRLTPFNSYDLLEVIVSAFTIPEKEYEFLYDLLDNLIENRISVDECIDQLDNIIIE